jgi:5'-nucleotidase
MSHPLDRRDFLSALGAAGAAAGLGTGCARPATAPGPDTPGYGRVTLLHTNDTHSRVEPFGPGNGSLSGRGGMARRATMVKALRKTIPNLLLLDAGDTFQGTPYFNLYKGRLDYKLMSLVGYDAGTLGNHDFDNGVEALLEAMQEATFDFVNCNFVCRDAPALGKRLRPYVIKDFPGIRVGITGVGVAFKGLVSPANHKGVDWMDPDKALKPVIAHLREKEKVDLVVLLSHLGYDEKGQGWDDLSVAKQVPGIDAIIGGHSHTFLDQPVKVANAGGETLVFQVGFAGVNLGRMDFVTARGEVKAAGGFAVPVVHQA